MTETAPAPGRRREVMVVLPGLMLAIALAMLDNMIVGTAMPRILGELGGLAHLSWVVTAYVLGTTVSTPIWGKIGDLYGRKNIFLASIVLFMIGSVLCGMAGSAMLGGPADGMAQLIAFRAIQGLGAGGLMVNAMAIIGDLVLPRERGQYQGLMAAVMSLAMIAGPLVGGFITDHLNWRWAFYVNLPVGFVALALLAVKLKLPRYRTEHRIDWLGAVLLSIGITALVLITTWGGNDYGWTSPQILGLAALAVVALALFVPVERRAAEPIMPLNVFRNRNFTLISLVGFLLGFAMFGAINFLPLFQQTVQGASATNSGLLLLPMMGAAMVVSLRRPGHHQDRKVQGLPGPRRCDHGDRHVAALHDGRQHALVADRRVHRGARSRHGLPDADHDADRTEQRRAEDLGVASSASTFFRSIGGSFGVSLFGAVFNNHLTSSLTDKLGPALGDKLATGGGQFNPAAMEQLPPNVRLGFLESLASSISSVFWWAILFAVLVPLIAAFIQEIPLRGGFDKNEEAETPVPVLE